MILKEFDVNKNAVINPDSIYKKVPGFPDTIISIFSHQLFNKLVTFFDGKRIAKTHDVDGEWPIFEVFYKEKKYALAKARLGAPACVGTFEDILAQGGKRIILLGNCGVLSSSIHDCGIIIPTKAIRDEGTSYHYAPADPIIEVNKKHKDLFKQVCNAHGYSFVEGTTWTTDAFYRETPKKVADRKNMGAICVDMECAAMQAMCDFREVDFFQFFYAGDNLDHPVWDPRSLSGNARLEDKEKIALLAFELAHSIE